MTPLRKARVLRKLTTVQVANAIGKTQSHYSKIERGEVCASPQLANEIARFFGNAVTRDQILYPEDYPEISPRSRKPVRSVAAREALQGAR